MTVTIISDTQTRGFVPFDDGEYIRTLMVTGTVEDTIKVANRDIGVKEEEMTNFDSDTDFACYDVEVNGICYSVNID